MTGGSSHSHSANSSTHNRENHMNSREKTLPVYSNTDLFFRHPAYESVWTRTWINQYSPVGNPDDARLTFNITPTLPGNYMNLSDAFIALELGIVDKDGKAPTTDDSVSIINSFTHSIFKVLV